MDNEAIKTWPERIVASNCVRHDGRWISKADFYLIRDTGWYLEGELPFFEYVRADLYEAQAKEIERLNTCLLWEENRSSHVGTHADNCHLWGGSHYRCLLRKYEEVKNKLQDQALQNLVDQAQELGMYDLPLDKDK